MSHSRGRSVDTGENGPTSSPKIALAGVGRTIHRRNASEPTLSTEAPSKSLTRHHPWVNTHYRRSLPAASEDTDQYPSHNDLISKQTHKHPTVPSLSSRPPPLATYTEPTPISNQHYILELLNSAAEALIYYIALSLLVIVTLAITPFVFAFEASLYLLCPLAGFLTDLVFYPVLDPHAISLSYLWPSSGWKFLGFGTAADAWLEADCFPPLELSKDDCGKGERRGQWKVVRMVGSLAWFMFLLGGIVGLWCVVCEWKGCVVGVVGLVIGVKAMFAG